ncbi:hypothetical protein B0H14DRAFT_3011486, partial [Mycena olivaceomarginata]
MRWLQLLLLLWLTLRTLRRRRRAVHGADGVRAYTRCGAGPGYFELGRLWLLRSRAGQAVVYMGRVRFADAPHALE